MDLQKLKIFLEEKAGNNEFSGSVLLAKEFHPIFKYVFGFANKEKHVPNKIDTKFNLGSCNKMFTGVAIAQLVKRGLLGFQDLVGKHLPDYPNQEVKEKVTIHHLLTHTSGMGHYLANKAKFLATRNKLKSIADFVNYFKDEPLSFEPGTKYEYSGNGFELLGAIIEAISGESYYEYVKENIFNVAGMQNTDSYELNPADQTIAVGYTRRGDDGEPRQEGERRDALFMALPKGGAGGGGYSTCPDMLKFCQALLENKLLNPETAKLVITPKVEVGTKNGETLYYGYGFQIMDVGDGHLRIGHGGTYAGVSARIDMYPWLNYTAIVLSNYDEPAAHKVANEIGKLILSI